MYPYGVTSLPSDGSVIIDDVYYKNMSCFPPDKKTCRCNVRTSILTFSVSPPPPHVTFSCPRTNVVPAPLACPSISWACRPSSPWTLSGSRSLCIPHPEGRAASLAARAPPPAARWWTSPPLRWPCCWRRRCSCGGRRCRSTASRGSGAPRRGAGTRRRPA